MPRENKTSAGAEPTSSGWLTALRTMPNETPQKMLIVTVSLCFVCALLVAGTAVALRPLQEANKALERKRNILQAAGLLEEGKSVEELFRVVDSKVVTLATGEYVEEVDAATFDQRRALKDPEQAFVIPRELDIAGIGTRSKRASVYLVRSAARLKYIILPVHGRGLWSTLYGFLALEADARTVAGLSFYEHRETAGLGSEVDNPQWREKWKGKVLFDETGKPRVEVIKGTVDEADPQSKFQVDGLAGATLTSRGVTNLLRYWVGDGGFGPYLANISKRGT